VSRSGLAAWIDEKCCRDWSPEQIAGYLGYVRVDYPEDQTMLRIGGISSTAGCSAAPTRTVMAFCNSTSQGASAWHKITQELLRKAAERENNRPHKCLTTRTR